MNTAKNLNEQAAAIDIEIEQRNKVLEKTDFAQSQLDNELSKVKIKAQQLAHGKAAANREMARLQNVVAQNTVAAARTNLKFNDLTIAYAGVAAVSNIFYNLIFSSSLVFSIMFVPIVQIDMNFLAGPFRRTIFVLETFSCYLLIHTIFVATQALNHGIKKAYQKSASADAVWEAFEIMVTYENACFGFYYTSFSVIYIVIVMVVFVQLAAARVPDEGNMIWKYRNQSCTDIDSVSCGNSIPIGEFLTTGDYITGAFCAIFAAIVLVLTVRHLQKVRRDFQKSEAVKTLKSTTERFAPRSHGMTAATVSGSPKENSKFALGQWIAQWTPKLPVTTEQDGETYVALGSQ